MDEPPSTLPPAFYSPTLFKSSIQLSLPPSSSSSSSSPTTTSIEPLPHLNYHLLHLLIALARPHLTKRELKRYDYLADARRCYYEALYKFQRAYRELLDAYSHGEALDHEFDAVANRTRGEQGEEEGGGVRQLCEVELARRKNNQHMRDLLEAVREKSRMRAAVTAWFSNLKWTFMKGGGWAVLEEVGRRSWRFVVLQQQHEMKDGIGGGVDVRPELALTAPRRDQPRDMMDGDEEHGSGSGGISPADVGMDELDDSTGGIEDGDVGLVSGGCCGERAQFRV